MRGIGAGASLTEFSFRHKLVDASGNHVDREVAHGIVAGEEARFSLDADQDGVFEMTDVFTDASRTLTLFDAAGATARVTWALNGGVPWLTTEERQDGELRVTGTGATEQEIAACSRRTPAQGLSCTPAEEAEIRNILRTGLEDGLACIRKYDETMANLLATEWIRGIAKPPKIRCGSSTTNLASYVPFHDAFNWYVDTCDSANELAAIAFHETLHRLGGYQHVGDLDDLYRAGAISSRSLAAADRTYACTSLCFSWPTPPTSCTCAACLTSQTAVAEMRPGDSEMRVVVLSNRSSQTVCAGDARCQELPSCVKRDANGVAYESEAVGALCRSSSATSASWHATLRACQASCTTTCDSYSRSCDQTCQ